MRNHTHNMYIHHHQSSFGEEEKYLLHIKSYLSTTLGMLSIQLAPIIPQQILLLQVSLEYFEVKSTIFLRKSH